MGNILSVFSYNILFTLEFPRKNFRSQGINIVPWRASEIVLLKRNFDSKIDADGDDAFSGHFNQSLPTFNLNLNGSDFSER